MAVEHELRDKVRLLTGVVENNMALIYAKDLEGRYLFYNGTFARAFVLDERAADEGTSAAEVLLGRDDSWLDPELQPVWRANDLRAREGSYYVEEWSDHPEHGRLYYDSIKFPLTDAKDVVYAVGGVSLDVTESRSAAVEVDRQRALLAEAQRIAAVGSWYVDLPDGAPVWSEEMRRILGVGPDASPPDVEGYVHQVVAEERERVRAELGAAFLQGREGESDHRFQRADGHVVHVHSQLRCARAPDGRVVRISGTTQDVTDRKHIEAELQRERRLLAEAQAVGRVGSGNGGWTRACRGGLTSSTACTVLSPARRSHPRTGSVSFFTLTTARAWPTRWLQSSAGPKTSRWSTAFSTETSDREHC